MVANNGFVEWANVHSRRYGTAKRSLEERIQSGTDVLLEIDYQGACRSSRPFPMPC
jgi:guanylate kinase